jgi:Tfp pilus assembly protein PilN
VALLGLEVQTEKRTLRLTGEAKSMDDVAAYVRRLRDSRRIAGATIASHEERLAGAVKVIRFSLEAGWSEPS